MRRRTPLVLGCALLVVLTLGFAAPLIAAPPELRIQDIDAARAYFDGTGSGWSLYGEVSYVYADSVRYQDNSVVRPHTDVDVWLWACPPVGDCIPLRGTTNLLALPDAADFTSMTEAWVEDVTVILTDPDGHSSGYVAEVEIVRLDWSAFGPKRNLRIIDPGVQVLIGKQRDATVLGTLEIVSGTGPFDDLVDTYDSFHSEVIENYNEVKH